MSEENIYKEIKRLNFEDMLWFIFAILSILNIYGDYDDKAYLKTHQQKYKMEANKVFTITLIFTLLIYIYFFLRNYKNYEQATIEEKRLYTIKLLGSSFLIAGIICLLYFQIKQNSFIGSPAL